MRYQPYMASFNGKFDLSKSKCLIILYLNGKQGNRGATYSQVLQASGIPKGSFHTSQLAKFNYVIRRLSLASGRPCYLYSIALRGTRFVEKRIPPEKYEEYLAEIKAHQAKLKAENPNIKFVVTLI